MKTLPFKSLQPTTYKSLGMRPAKKLVLLSNPCHDEQGRFCSDGGGGGSEVKEKDGFFGAGHTPEYYLKKLAKLDCPDDIQAVAKDIVQMKPYNEDIGEGFNRVTTRWDGNSLYHYSIWEKGSFQRVQFEADTGYVDWGQGVSSAPTTHSLSTPLQKKTKPKPGSKPRLVRINGLLAHQTSSRVDPTRTTGLRNRWAAEMGRRFTALRRLVWKAIVDDDCFGLGPAYKMYRPTSPTIHIKFDFPRLEDKIPAFMQWLQQQQDEGILELVTLPRMGQSLGEPWTNMFVKDSYSRGVIRAREQLMQAGYGAPGIGAGDLPLMGLPGMASGILANPFHVDRLASMFLRSFDTLKGITADMDKNISHILAQGLADGDNPITLAKKMNYVISGMGKDLGITDSLGRFIPAERRAKMLARTEVIRSHAVSTLQEYKNWGVAGVGVVAEFTTKGFNVCPLCQELARNGPYTIEQAWNMIPAHPHCFCCWIPRPMAEINVHYNRPKK